MNHRIAGFLIVVAGGAAAGGCGILPDAFSGCDKAKPYQSAQESPPLKVPDGAELPDTRDAMKIPEVRTPEAPAADGRCLDHPPSYGGSRPSTG